MDYSALKKSTLFLGIPADQLCDDLEDVPHHIQYYDKGETVFHLMETADRIGIIIPERKPDQCFRPKPRRDDRVCCCIFTESNVSL